MMEEFKKFKELFEQTKKKGWIKSLRKGDTGVGYTFEKTIGKDEENLPIADYGSIEIKTTRKYSTFYRTLNNIKSTIRRTL